ncbi:MAG TPA: S41 family peptidase, partial [Chlamydiales bacterium]|nr:S41 family peptidase [Chlamydiales bacterium]
EGPDGISAVNDVKKALDDLAQKGPIKGLILDLRDNRGGFLMQAVGVAGLFIKSGVIVISKTADGKEHFFRDLKPGIEYTGPLVILTSKMTASAAEIVTQALQDYGVAIVVGDERTYGKGSIQMQTVTTKGVDSPLKITVGQYYSVSGKSTQVEGVKADIVVPSVFFNRRMGEEYLHFPLALEGGAVPAAFDDKLIDIEPAMKEWYLQYYLPNLQTPVHIKPQVRKELQARSKERMDKNQEYQRFLSGLSLYKVVKHGDKEETVKLTKEEAQRRIWALQMQEAVNVAKDLAELQTKV